MNKTILYILPLISLLLSCTDYPLNSWEKTKQEYKYTLSNPVWVSDSRLICFISRNKDKEGLLLCELNAFTGDAAELLSKPDSIYMKGNLSISRDKHFLLFDGATYSNYFFSRQIYRFDRLSKVITSITNESHNENPEFSPDGSKVIFDSGYMFDDTKGVAKTHIQNVDGTGRYPIDPDLNNWDRFGRFLNDGRRIVVQTSRTAMRSSNWILGELYAMNLDGTNPIRIALGDLGSSYPYPSPTNNDLLYLDLSEGAGQKMGYKIVNVDAIQKPVQGGSQPISDTFVHLDIPLTVRKLKWSPTGKRIAISGTTETRNEQYNLYVINRDGTGFRRLTSGLNTIDFSWSDNGEYLVAVNQHTTSEVGLPYYYIIQVDGGGMQKVTVNAQEILSN